MLTHRCVRTNVPMRLELVKASVSPDVENAHIPVPCRHLLLGDCHCLPLAASQVEAFCVLVVEVKSVRRGQEAATQLRSASFAHQHDRLAMRRAGCHFKEQCAFMRLVVLHSELVIVPIPHTQTALSALIEGERFDLELAGRRSVTRARRVAIFAHAVSPVHAFTTPVAISNTPVWSVMYRCVISLYVMLGQFVYRVIRVCGVKSCYGLMQRILLCCCMLCYVRLRLCAVQVVRATPTHTLVTFGTASVCFIF